MRRPGDAERAVGDFSRGPAGPAVCPVEAGDRGAHRGVGDTDTGRYFVDNAAWLLAALRLWAQSQFRSDQVVRDVLEAIDVIALRAVADELRQLGTIDGETAGWAIAEIAKRSSGELMVVAGYAARAL